MHDHDYHNHYALPAANRTDMSKSTKNKFEAMKQAKILVRVDRSFLLFLLAGILRVVNDKTRSLLTAMVVKVNSETGHNTCPTK